jgi:hypothetical protein
MPIARVVARRRRALVLSAGRRGSVMAGAPASFSAECGSGCSSGDLGASLLTPTTDGFLLLSGSATIKAYWLDNALVAKGSAIDLGTPNWFSLSAVAAGGAASICVSVPYGFVMVNIDRKHVVSSTYAPPSDIGKTGMALGLFAEAGGVSAVWGSRADTVRHATVTSALGVSSYDGAPIAVARTHDGVVAVTRTNDGTVVVSRAPSKE